MMIQNLKNKRLSSVILAAATIGATAISLVYDNTSCQDNNYTNGNFHRKNNEINNINNNNNNNNNNNQRLLDRNFVSKAVELVSPSVVNILISVDNILFKSIGSGSGFIIDKQGYCVTNAHVVSGALQGQKVLITCWNGEKKNGIVHSIDKISDIALLKMENDDNEDLPFAILGNSNDLKLGEFVVALGSPLHLMNSVTFGIISATARHASELGLAKNRAEYLQTDAAINLGNSGGPLVNLDGEVIGVNTLKVQGTQGISFAIPVDRQFRQIIDQLKENRKVIRPYIGLRMANYLFDDNGNYFKRGVQKEFDEMFSTNDIKVLVVDVEKNGPAEKAGIQKGDIIIEVDKRPLKNGYISVLNAIGLDIGNSISFKIIRGGRSDPIDIVVITQRKQ